MQETRISVLGPIVILDRVLTINLDKSHGK